MTDQQAMAPWQAPRTTDPPPSEWAGPLDLISNAQEPASTVEPRDKRLPLLQNSHALARHAPHPSPEAQRLDTKTCVALVNPVVEHGLKVTAETSATPTRIPPRTPTSTSPNCPNTTTRTHTPTPVPPTSPVQAGAAAATSHQRSSTKKTNTAATHATANPSKTALLNSSAPHLVAPAPRPHKVCNNVVLVHQRDTRDERTRGGRRCDGSGPRCMRRMIFGIS